MRAETVKSEQIVRAWGNGLAIRITSNVAKALKLAEGVPVTLELSGAELVVKASAVRPRLTLAEKLARFDPKVYRGPMEASGRVGAEMF